MLEMNLCSYTVSEKSNKKKRQLSLSHTISQNWFMFGAGNKACDYFPPNPAEGVFHGGKYSEVIKYSIKMQIIFYTADEVLVYRISHV